ncbi:MAG: TlpA family protein disulfide reductase [Chlorobiaceae bacterium]|jgi:cytochrome c biogenesis protein CcmG, thiol:disulfide interchange protein DsbE|nr:TlpA family protein disulfide reductase [Chlorobiaceae bacterium]
MLTIRLKKFRRLLLASLVCLSFSGTSYALEAGSKAPGFSLPGVQGGMVELSSTAGSVVYVDFWASWCGPCKQSFGWMNAMQDKYKAQGLKIIGVNLDTKTEDAKKFLSQNPARFTVAFDSKGATPKDYGVKGMPTSFLMDRNGKVIFQHLGFKEADREKLEKEIKAALEAKK